jgi:N-acetylglutamate synthase-like GNAT family acetyltransferase
MLTIRKASLEDYETIVNIMKESATEEELRGFVPPEGISSKFLEELRNELDRSDHGAVVAEKAGIPVGFAYYRLKNDSAGIEEVDVKKDCQGQGVGRSLVQYIENMAKERGLKRLVTGTSIDREGKPWKAYGFWVHMGFVDAGKRIEGIHGLKYAEFVKQLSHETSAFQI